MSRRTDRIATFDEFWPFYVSQHLSTTCRAFHFAGTTCAIVFVLGFLVTWNWAFLPLGLVTSYGPAWIGHFVFEKNRPATFQYPLWSLAADFVMYGKMWTGQMEAEIARIADPTEA